ncbi:MAG TPA: sulfite exporter TauE/SafE family protein [Candidatus Angelobacter sp.]
MLFRCLSPGEPATIIPSMNWLYLLLGLFVGVVSGVVGTGGGVLIVPALVYLFHMNQHKAQGTSLGALLAPIGILAFWEYRKAGNVDLTAALLIALGFAVGGYFGGLWAQHLSEPVLRRALGVLLLIVGVRLLLGGQ